MIYSGTFPNRPTGTDQLNVVDVGDTGRGKWARSLVKAGKDAGSRRWPAQAMLSLGRYWENDMPGGDKAWWVARADAQNFRTRAGNVQTVTGYALFLISNMAALTLGLDPVKLPPILGDNMLPVLDFDSIDGFTRRLKVFCYFQDVLPVPWFMQFFISAVRPWNVTQADPLTQTELIGMVEPNEVVIFPALPTIPQYLYLPWDVDAGDVVGFHLVYRFGDQGVAENWWAETAPASIVEITVD